jgi:2-polyprenyl-3-methyl-5-hydroxy-6-metoxy-1,4-benzoquinol methylase
MDRIRDWESTYRETNVEEMPWFYPELDPDLKEEIESRGIKEGKFLDMGTGPGTQAVALAKMGFEVTGSDISETSIEKARKLSSDVEWVVDDSLNTKLGEYDYIFDRGVFHVMDPGQREKHIQTLKKVLKPGGLLFLKCFSSKQPPGPGPYRYSEEELRELFQEGFEIEKIKETIYHGRGTGGPPPKALFVVMKKR